MNIIGSNYYKMSFNMKDNNNNEMIDNKKQNISVNSMKMES